MFVACKINFSCLFDVNNKSTIVFLHGQSFHVSGLSFSFVKMLALFLSLLDLIVAIPFCDKLYLFNRYNHVNQEGIPYPLFV